MGFRRSVLFLFLVFVVVVVVVAFGVGGRPAPTDQNLERSRFHRLHDWVFKEVAQSHNHR